MKDKYDKRKRGYKVKSKALKKVLKRGGPSLEKQVVKDMVLDEIRRRKRKGVDRPNMESIKRKVNSELMKEIRRRGGGASGMESIKRKVKTALMDEIRTHNLKLTKTKKKKEKDKFD